MTAKALRPRVDGGSDPSARWTGEPLFVYGSLSWPEVLATVLGRRARTTPARLHGWTTVALQDRVFPGLVPAADGQVEGLLVEDLEAAEWLLLDRFEALWYDLRSLELADGRQAWAYVCGPGAPVLPQGWDRRAFEAEHLTTYVQRCADWRRQRLRADPTYR